MRNNFFFLTLITTLLILQSCSSKKDILYFQDLKNYNREYTSYQAPDIQPNDILSIIVTTSVPEASIPYNVQVTGNSTNFDLEAIRLQGYLVSKEQTIVFPVLGKISLKDMTIVEAEHYIKNLLSSGGHLLNPTVSIRLLNAKVTVLGEVNNPSTFTFTEQNITLLQAIGLAGDLTITGKRKDVLIIREENGIQTMNRIDLTKSNWFGGPFYYIKPNDTIIVNPNNTRVKSAGFIGNASVVLTLASLILTSIVLTR